MEKRATIYQRWRESDGVYRWHKVKYHPNKKPITDPRATQFMVRYTESGKRKQTPFDSIDPAMDFCRQKNIQFATEREGGQPTPVTTDHGAVKTPMAQALEKCFANLEARGIDSKSIRTYRYAVNSFVESCKKQFVEDVGKQDMLDFMRCLRRQPYNPRKHGNPERTYSNKCNHVAILLKAYGVSGLLKKREYPQYHEKKVVAHTDDELALLYSVADSDERFLLDYFVGTMVRDHEAYGAKYTDLTGTTLTVRGKGNKTRTVEVSPRTRDAIRERQKASESEYLFPNTEGRPDQHLLRKLQNLAKRAGAEFHVELHKLRKTGASRRFLADPHGLITLMHEL